MQKKIELRRRQQQKASNASGGNSQVPTLTKMKKKKKSVGKPLKGEDIQIIFGILIVICIFSMFGYYIYRNILFERVRKPLGVKKIIPSNSTTPLAAPLMFWGSYRPGNYFGLKTRSLKSPVAGLMWVAQQGQPKLRHWCDQADGLLKYGWVAHDGENFGKQDIVDHGFAIQTQFVKRPGGDHGGDWTARVIARPMPGQENIVISLIFYFSLDGDEGSLEPLLKKGILVGMNGRTPKLGEFSMEFIGETSHLQKFDYLFSYAPTLNSIKDTVYNSFKLRKWGKGKDSQYIGLGGHVMERENAGKENIVAFQVTTAMPYEFDIVFQSQSYRSRPNKLTRDIFNVELQKHLFAFDKKFEDLFHLGQKKYNANEIQFAKSALSNMLGGIGYFYGTSIVQSHYNDQPIAYWESPLYTAVPSRSFFPRGFLWDEGFHNLLISKWSPAISKDIIGHWLDLMNVEGWIPREQILGSEARARVPAEFIVQRNTNANPPTLFLPLKQLVSDMIKSSKPEDKKYLKNLFPRLKAWFNWYNTSQAGDQPSTYRWKGRNAQTQMELNPKTLTSGLDDYPRASHPTDDERHLDLRCWMALAAGIMADISEALNQGGDVFSNTKKMLTDNDLLDKLHWSEDKERYCDYGLHTDQSRLQRPKPPKNLQPGQAPPQLADLPMERIILKDPKLQFISSYGYVSLFPFLLNLIDPSSPKLTKILTDLTKPDLLWTPYGLRSLARTSPFYKKRNTEHDPPYWRGYIWININYLAVRALHLYASVEGPSQTLAKNIYKELRDNLVKNIYKQYEKTGYIWENYDDMTGQGKGSHPFTGWSSLVVLMMAESF